MSKCAIPSSDWPSDYQKRWRKDHRTKIAGYAHKITVKRRLIINKFKDVPCTDCGVRYEWYVMQFDHRDSVDKAFAISAGITLKLEDLLDEIAKCDVVCANCHAIRTYKRRCQGEMAAMDTP